MEKHNLYHLKPKNMKGDTLHPLNVLKDKHPDAYAEEVKKYAGREYLMKKKVLPLGVDWNDVLHLSAVHPDKIKEALAQAGSTRADNDIEHYEIDPRTLDPKDTVVYINNSDSMDEGDFFPYDPSDIDKYSSLPEETKTNYKERIAAGYKPYLYHRVPHILYKGSIKVK